MKNTAASVRARLTSISRICREELQSVLTRYAIERFLYRLSVSPHGGGFVLKGAMLFRLWTAEPHRTTKDVDLLGCGESSIERLTAVMGDVCATVVPDDGLRFDPSAVSASRIKEGQEYEGIRVICPVRLGNARIMLRIDVGFGDAVTPAPQPTDFPTILDFPVPVLMAYPRETVVAEKFQAMTVLGMQNSRMKDFFDLWVLSRDFAFDGAWLGRAVAATFRRRGTLPPIESPRALTAEFGTDPAKTAQWEAFLRKGKFADRPPPLESVVGILADFLMPPSRAAAADERFDAAWAPGGTWAISRE